MSNKVLTPVIDHSHMRGAPLLLLVMIADSAGDEGHAWAYVSTLAGKTRTSERQVQQHLAELVKAGELIILELHGRGRMSHFWIPILEGETGYDPQPCTMPHRCNGSHTPLSETERARTLALLQKVRKPAPIKSEKGEGFRTKGEENCNKKVRVSAQKVRKTVNLIATGPHGNRAGDTPIPNMEPKEEPKEEPTRVRARELPAEKNENEPEAEPEVRRPMAFPAFAVAYCEQEGYTRAQVKTSKLMAAYNRYRAAFGAVSAEGATNDD